MYIGWQAFVMLLKKFKFVSGYPRLDDKKMLSLKEVFTEHKRVPSFENPMLTTIFFIFLFVRYACIYDASGVRIRIQQSSYKSREKLAL
jgi:hypothetical protein